VFCYQVLALSPTSLGSPPDPSSPALYSHLSSHYVPPLSAIFNSSLFLVHAKPFPSPLPTPAPPSSPPDPEWLAVLWPGLIKKAPLSLSSASPIPPFDAKHLRGYICDDATLHAPVHGYSDGLDSA
jgi:hypothetical protein